MEHHSSAQDMITEMGRFIDYCDGNYVCVCAICDRRYRGAKGSRQCLVCAKEEAIQIIKGWIHLVEELRKELHEKNKKVEIIENFFRSLKLDDRKVE
jgi:phosphoribosyl-dephospho-CoA transferase